MGDGGQRLKGVECVVEAGVLAVVVHEDAPVSVGVFQKDQDRVVPVSGDAGVGPEGEDLFGVLLSLPDLCDPGFVPSIAQDKLIVVIPLVVSEQQHALNGADFLGIHLHRLLVLRGFLQVGVDFERGEYAGAGAGSQIEYELPIRCRADKILHIQRGNMLEVGVKRLKADVGMS